MDPRTIDPTLPSGSGMFWLSFFFGPFGYFSAWSNKQQALIRGVATEHYHRQWMKGWLVTVAVAAGVLFSLLVLGLTARAMSYF